MFATVETCKASVLLSYIISSYFSNLYSTLIYYEENSSTMSLVCDVENAVAASSGVSVVWMTYSDEIEKNHNRMLSAIENGCEGYIFIAENVSDMITIKDETNNDPMNYFKQRDRILLLLTTDEHLDVDKFFSQNLFNGFPNHILITPNGIWTQKFIGNDPESAVYLGHPSTATNQSIFIDKKRDLKGKIISTGGINYAPYSVCLNLDSPTGNMTGLETKEQQVFFDGSEVRVLQEFCQRFNCTLKVYCFDKDNFGVIYPNGSSDGLIGGVYSKQFDCAVGGLFRAFEDQIEFANHYLAESTATLLVPGRRIQSFILTPFLMFSSATWIALFITIIIIIILFYLEELIAKTIEQSLINLKNNLKRNGTRDVQLLYSVSLIVIAIFLQQPNRLRFHSAITYLFLAIVLMSAVIIENAYSGNLKSSLTIPRYGSGVNTLSKFNAKGYKWGAPHEVWIFPIQDATDHNLQDMVKKFEVHNIDYLITKMQSDSYGVILEKLNCGYYSFYNFVTPETIKHRDIMKDGIYYSLTYLASVKGWPFIKEFDEITLHIKEAGLFDAWEIQLVNKYLDFTIENILLTKGHGKPEPIPPRKLEVAHITGALVILITGQLIGLCVFLWELKDK